MLEHEQLAHLWRHGDFELLLLDPVDDPPHGLLVQKRGRAALAGVVQIQLDRHLGPVPGPVHAPVLAVHVGLKLVPGAVLQEAHPLVQPDDGTAFILCGHVGLDPFPHLGGKVCVVDDAALAVAVAGNVDAVAGAGVDEGDVVALVLGAGDQGEALGGGEDVLDGEGDDGFVLAGVGEEGGEVEGFWGWRALGEEGGVLGGEDVLEDGGVGLGLGEHGGFLFFIYDVGGRVGCCVWRRRSEV